MNKELFRQLGISEKRFESIISDKATCGEIVDCLVYCLYSVPALSNVASDLLQHITGNGEENEDGGPGSGNFGHKGVPGQVGGSAATNESLNDPVREATKGSYSDFGKAVRKSLSDMNIGDKVTVKGKTYTKTGENEWEYEWNHEYHPGEMSKANINSIANSCRQTDEEYIPKFEKGKAPKNEESIERKERQETTQILNSAKAVSTEKYKKAVSEYSKDFSDDHYAGTDEAKAVVQTGYNKKPTLVSPKDFDDAVKSGEYTICKRGVGATIDYETGDVFATSADYVDDFKNRGNDAWLGGGNYGAGYHFFVGKEADRAKGFASSTDVDDGAVIECAIKPDAKLVDWKEYESSGKTMDPAEYVMSKGADGIISDTGVACIINRGCLLCKDDSRTDGGPGSGNFNHEGVKGQLGGSAPSGSSSCEAWKERNNKAREDLKAMKPGRKAATLTEMYGAEHGDPMYDEILTAFRAGKIDEKIDEYFDIVEENGDPTPTKPTVDKQKSLLRIADTEYGGDHTEARIETIRKDTGLSREKAEKLNAEIGTWTSNQWDKADKASLDEYVENAPAYEGTISRGLCFKDNRYGSYDDFMETAKSGVIRMNGNSSWTTDDEVSRRYAHPNDSGIDSVIIKCVKNKTATPIEHLTTNGGEDEVLAHSRAAWTVLNATETEKNGGGRLAVITVIERGEYEDAG